MLQVRVNRQPSCQADGFVASLRLPKVLRFSRLSPNEGNLASGEPLVMFEPRAHRLQGWIVDFPSQVPRRLLKYPERDVFASRRLGLQGLQGLQEKGLQSRSATASLLIKNYQCIKKYSLLFYWPRKANTLFKPAEENRET